MPEVSLGAHDSIYLPVHPPPKPLHTTAAWFGYDTYYRKRPPEGMYDGDVNDIFSDDCRLGPNSSRLQSKSRIGSRSIPGDSTSPRARTNGVTFADFSGLPSSKWEQYTAIPAEYSATKNRNTTDNFFWIQISRLLDVPKISPGAGILGQAAAFRVRTTDSYGSFLAQSEDLVCHRDPSALVGHRTETVMLGPEGNLRLQSTSSSVYLHLEHLSGHLVGTCYIHRNDPRSSQRCSYTLEYEGKPSGGIELRVVEMSDLEQIPPHHGYASRAFLHGAQTGPEVAYPGNEGHYMPMETPQWCATREIYQHHKAWGYNFQQSQPYEDDWMRPRMVDRFM